MSIKFDDLNSTLSADSTGFLVNASVTGNYCSAQSIDGIPSGKRYWEIIAATKTNSNLYYIGVGTDVVPSSNVTQLSVYANTVSFLFSTGEIFRNNAVIGTASACTIGDVIGIAFDADTGEVWFSKNGVWLVNGDPANGLNPITTLSAGTFKPVVQVYEDEASFLLRTSNQYFSYPIPSGFEHLQGIFESPKGWLVHNYRADLSNSNRTLTKITSTAWDGNALYPRRLTNGKYYYEVLLDDTYNNFVIGWAFPYFDSYIAQFMPAGAIFSWTGEIFPYGPVYGALSPGDVVGIAMDIDNGEIYFSRNGTWLGTSNPETRTDPALTGISGDIYPMISLYDRYSECVANFNTSDFQYTMPSGYEQLEQIDLYASISLEAEGGSISGGSADVTVVCGTPNASILAEGGSISGGSASVEIDVRSLDQIRFEEIKNSFLLTHNTVYGNIYTELYRAPIDISDSILGITSDWKLTLFDTFLSEEALIADPYSMWTVTDVISWSGTGNLDMTGMEIWERCLALFMRHI